jgi:Protein of unknown function (DUF3109).
MKKVMGTAFILFKRMTSGIKKKHYFCSMIIIDNVVVTDGFLNARFCCNLARCKGECCVAGDAGAPLEESEISEIEDNLEAIKPYMRPEGIAVVENNDVYDYDDFGELVTPLVNGEECAFVYFHENGTALCAIEKAYLENKSSFWKPISCHLYPIRLMKKDGFIHIIYHEWSVCVPAKRKGESEGIPLYKFLKGPLIRRFGEDWHERLIKKNQWMTIDFFISAPRFKKLFKFSTNNFVKKASPDCR